MTESNACMLPLTNNSVSEPWTGEREDESANDWSETNPRQVSKAYILLAISKNPGLYADDLAERLGIPTKLAVDLVGELIDEGILESEE